MTSKDMLRNFKDKISSFLSLEIIALILCLALITASTFNSLISKELTAGWDALFSFDLFEKSVHAIRHFDFFPVDLNTYGGQALFFQYPPLLFWALASIYLLFFQWVPTVIFWNIFVYLIPFIFYFLFLNLVKNTINKKSYILITSLATLPILFISEFGSSLGLGFSGLINGGLVPAAFSLLIFISIFQVTIQIDNEDTSSKWTYAKLALLSVIMGLTHAAGLIAAGFLFLYLYIRQAPKKGTAILITGLSTLLLLSPWLYFFIKNAYFIYSTPGKIDFTGFWVINWMLFYSMDPWHGMPIEKVFIYAFQCLGTLLAITSVFCLVFIKKHHLGRLWLMAGIILLLGVPNGDFISLSNTNYHFYRLSAYGCILTAYLICLFLNEYQQKWKLALWTYLCLMLGCLAAGAIPFSKSNRELFGGFDGKLHNTEYYKNSIAPLIEDLKNGNFGVYRIVSDGDLRLRPEAAGPHSVNYELARLKNIEVMMGLYAEGSPTHTYLINSLHSLNSWSIFWGAKKLYLGFDQRKNSGSELNFLAYMGIDHLVLNNPDVATKLLEWEPNKIELIKTYGPLFLLKIKHPQPLNSHLENLPPAYIQTGPGNEKNNFFAFWSSIYDLKDKPLIFIKGGRLENVNWTDFSTAILHLKDEYKGLMPMICDIAKEHKKNFVIFGVSELPCPELSQQILLMTQTQLINGMLESEFSEKIFKLTQFSPPQEGPLRKNIENPATNGHLILKTQGPTLIRYAYFPMWEELDKKGHIYEAYPNFMYINYIGDLKLYLNY